MSRNKLSIEEKLNLKQSVREGISAGNGNTGAIKRSIAYDSLDKIMKYIEELEWKLERYE